MQEYKQFFITKDEIRPVAERMRAANVHLAMIHGYEVEDGTFNVSYEYEINPAIESYTVKGEKVLPTISDIYDLGAEWPERELQELMAIRFEGLNNDKRLFMPDTMVDGQGHILVTPMKELIKEVHEKKEDQE